MAKVLRHKFDVDTSISYLAKYYADDIELISEWKGFSNVYKITNNGAYVYILDEDRSNWEVKTTVVAKPAGFVTDSHFFTTSPDTFTANINYVSPTSRNIPLIITDATQATSKDSGTIVTEGGVGVEKNLYVGGNIVGSGSLSVGLTSTFTAQSNFNGPVVVNGTVDSTTKDNGSIVTEGGIGVEKSVTIGQNLKVVGQANLTASTTSTDPTTGCLITTGGVGVGENLNVGGDLSVSGTVQFIDTDTALTASSDILVPSQKAVKTYIDRFAPSLFININNLALSNNVSDSNNDIDIAAGTCMDSTYTYCLTLDSGITKRLDANWSSGTGNGGLDTGAKAVSTTYHVFIIRKDSDESCDILFSTSVSSPSMPVGYTYKRRIGSVITNASGNIIQFKHYWQIKTYKWESPIEDYDAYPVGLTTVNLPLTVPSGIRCEALVLLSAEALSSNNAGMLDDGDRVTLKPPVAVATPDDDIWVGNMLESYHVAGYPWGGFLPSNLKFITDTSRNLKFLRVGAATQGIKVQNFGYIDFTV